MQKKQLILALLAGIALSGTAQAALHDRGSGLIYDDVLNITWLQDANYAKTSGYAIYPNFPVIDGMMNWSGAVAWAAGLSYGGYDDWRLPTMVDTGTLGCTYAGTGTDCGYNVQTVSGGTVYSEMAHMYYNNLGLKAYSSPAGNYQADFGIFGNGTYNGVDRSSFGQNDVGLIHNLQASEYWSGLEYAPITGTVWYFGQYDGSQDWINNDDNLYAHAWAVRPGDVAAVPEADTWAMLLAGLGLVGVAARRRRG